MPAGLLARTQAKVAFLEGERQALEHLKSDLLRRVKMLEYSLRQERSKYLQLQNQVQLQTHQTQTPAGQTVPGSDDAAASSNKTPSPEPNQLVPGHASAVAAPPAAIAGSPTGAQAAAQTAALAGMDPAAMAAAAAAAQASATTLSMGNGALLNFSKGYGNLRSRELLKSYLKEADALLASTSISLTGRSKRATVLDDADGTAAAAVPAPQQAASEGEAVPVSSVVRSSCNAAPAPRIAPKESLRKPGKVRTAGSLRTQQQQKEAAQTTPVQTKAPETVQEDSSNSATLRPSKTAAKPPAEAPAETDAYDPNKTLSRNSSASAAAQRAAAAGSFAHTNGSSEHTDTDAKTRAAASEWIWEPSATLRNHLDSVRDVVFHPKERAVFTASEDQTVKLWSLSRSADGGDIEPLHTFRGHTDAVTALAVSPLGDRLYSASGDATIRAWRVPSLDQQPYLPGDPSIKLNVFGGHTDAIWDLRLHPLLSQHPLLASASADGTIKLLDTTDDALGLKMSLWYDTGRDPSASNGASVSEGEIPTALAWTHHDLAKLVAGFRNGAIRMYDVTTGASVLQLDAPASGLSLDTQVNAVLCHPSMELVISAHEDSTIRFYDIKSGKCVHKMAAHTDAVTSIDISPSGLSVASSSHDGSLRWWDLSMKRMHQELPAAHGRKSNESVWAVRYHPTDDSLMASGGADALCRLYQLASSSPSSRPLSPSATLTRGSKRDDAANGAAAAQ
ncbi:1,2-dihydroxy-3-keto-5-methylthiopentene dioxygenase [Polyrhizophydium stewartii]|uniref:1,2-dihydroxy-3-keto-5-methylthiopentene dioxygenase n=1 Tax=Polyrhizophydium stewartii TaxID=2732419 RepID=A0ABR4NDN1_9FUNG